MSRSPASAESTESAAEYFRAFDTVYRLHEEGRSFSGRERHCAFLNPAGASERFANVSATSGLDLIDDGRAAAAVDWDHDGDLDLWVANRTAPQLRFLRNDRPRDDRHLAVLPVGRTVNRDAVGARAELHLRRAGDAESVRLVRSRRAGSGFLAQSSSWLHFGLEPGAEVDRLVVHWPGGESETFHGLKAGGRYQLLQGNSGEGAERWQTPSRPSELALTEPPAGPAPTPRRALLVSRPPIPEVSYRSFGGATVDLSPRLAGPTLLNLWASWCLPCAAELGDLEKRSGELRSAGLEILALSVDGLDPEKGTGPEQARAFVERLDASFTFGLARRPLLDKLQLLHDRMFSRRIPFAVPTSLLIDSNGRLAAVYRGPIDVDTLLTDVRNLGAAVTQRRKLATPFPGRWYAQPQAMSLETVAKRFAEDGFEEDAARYLRHALAEQGESTDLHLALGQLLFRQGKLAEATDEYKKVLAARPDDAEANAVLADLLAATGKAEEALAYYERSLELRPSAATSFNLGNALHLLGRVDDAITRYRWTLEIDGDFADAHNNLAALLLERGDLAGAITHLEQTLRLKPGSADAHNNLGVLLLRQGRSEEAAERFARALEIDPEHAGARGNLDLARRARQ